MRPDGAPAPPFDDAFRRDLAALFRRRRDVRHFHARPVPAGMVEDLLALANLAPSVGLSQPWRFVLVDDAARRARVRANFAACNRQALAAREGDEAGLYARLKLAGLDRAPCHLAVFVEDDPAQGRGLGRQTMPQTVAFSAVMAVHTLWLAARAIGLGVGWVSIVDPAAIAAILEVPAGWSLVAYLCVGYPEGDDDVPELEREGWEHRRPPLILRR